LADEVKEYSSVVAGMSDVKQDFVKANDDASVNPTGISLRNQIKTAQREPPPKISP